MKPDKRRDLLKAMCVEFYSVNKEGNPEEFMDRYIAELDNLDLDKGELHRCICGGGEGSIDDCEQADLIVNNILSKLKEKREGNAD